MGVVRIDVAAGFAENDIYSLRFGLGVNGRRYDSNYLVYDGSRRRGWLL
jgi:hypothetical protein